MSARMDIPSGNASLVSPLTDLTRLAMGIMVTSGHGTRTNGTSHGDES